MTTTFEVINSKDYFNYFLVAQSKDFLTEENYNSSRHAVACAMFAYHQREWIWKSNKNSVKDYFVNSGIINISQSSNDDFVECKFNEYVNLNCPEFLYIREICNGAKHLTVRGRISNTSKRAGGFNGGFSGQSVNTDDLIIEDNSGCILIFKEIIRSVVSFWEDMFKKLGI